MKPKICKIHGELTQDQCLIEKCISGITRRCKLCRAQKRAQAAFKGIECAIHGKLDFESLTELGKCKFCHYTRKNELRNARRLHDKKHNPEKIKKVHQKDYTAKRLKYGALLSLKKCCDKYGITLEQYQRVYEEQNGLCAICFQKETRRDGRTKSITKTPMRLAIDHDHKTGKFRGLLCHNCNTAIGKFLDDPVRMFRAIRYVKQGGFLS